MPFQVAEHLDEPVTDGKHGQARLNTHPALDGLGAVSVERCDEILLMQVFWD